MRIALVQGTRPEIIKNYPIVKALAANKVSFEVLHTNQHHSRFMSTTIYRDMAYEPDRMFPGKYRFGAAIDWLQRIFVKDRISHVIVNGDTAASLVGALSALYLDIEVSHVEAGLRSGDTHMLEERNRIMVDSIAGSLFAYTEYERELLHNSPGIRGRTYLEGNTTVDVLHDFADRFSKPLIATPYIYATMHRKEFTDSRSRLATVFGTLRRIADEVCTVIFPIHPRTRDAADRYDIRREALGAVQLIDPVSVFDSLSLQKHAAAILTDSGCVQEEAYLLHVPCVTVRDNTERHLTLKNGANVLTGFGQDEILSCVKRAIQIKDRDWPKIYGSTGVGNRIVNRIYEHPAEPLPALTVATAGGH